METVTEFLKTLAVRGVKLSSKDGQLDCYAPSGALTSEIRKGIVRYKPEILALLETRERKPQDVVRASSPKVLEFPLSVGQKGLYILQQINPAMTAYNLPLCVRVRGDLNVALLDRAWSVTLDQYPVLSARIVESDGVLRHHVDGACRTSIRQQTVSFDDQAGLIDFLRGRVKQPFDLSGGPLSRIELFTIGNGERILLITIHHMIFDGVSAVVLLRSLLANYQALAEGKPLSVSPERTGYEEFVSWEESMLASNEGRSHADYWQQRLSGDLPSIELFPDLPRRATPSFEGASIVETLPAELSRSIRDFAKERSFLPSVVFLAAFKLLLRRYTSLDDIIVGMPVIVRPGQKFASEIGYFINMVPLRTACSDRQTLSQFLREVRKTMLDAIYHSSYPFELMLDKLRTKSSTKNAVFQVNFAYQNFIGDDSFAAVPGRPGLDITNVAEIGPEGYSDLGMEIFDKDAAFSIHLRYNPDVYSTVAMQRFCRHFAALLESIATEGERALHEYSMVPADEKRKLLVEFNDTAADYPKDKRIHDFFAEQVAEHPDRTAAVFGNDSLTYRELKDRTTALAAHLQSLGIGPDDVVGLCLGRSLEMMTAIMGTVQAGGAYLPLDPDYPDDRLTWMLEDSNTPVVLTQEKFRDRVNSLVAPGTTVICLDTEWSRVESTRGNELRDEVTSRNVAYVIYTSGSTGKPKGALLEHQALVNRINWMQKCYQLDGRDVVLQKTPYSFDVSVWEFFWPMLAGAAVVFAVPDGHKDVRYLETLINERGVTTLHFVPSMLRAYLDGAAGTCPSVRQIFASGEALDKQSCDRYRARFPNALLHNLYGPTEAAIDVTSFDCSALTLPFVPIGKPIDNIQLYVLDRNNHPLPIGVAGELHIAGDGLARGYLNRPELTQEKFVANPFTPGARMYRTGDLACWMDDGNIQYLGRIDTQIKIRGFRVEIGEIEARLNQFPRIQDSAVIARGEGADKQLIGFYRTVESGHQIPSDELRAHLLRALPDYMVPTAFVSVPVIPLSSNGKVDRRALSRMDVSIASTRAYVAPRNETEAQLVAIWAEVLNVGPETVGVDDDFFELGGHSLRAAQLIARMRTELNVDVPLKAFFEGGSVARVARLIAGAEASDVRSIPVADRSSFDRLPLSFAQERLWFIDQLEPGSAGYNLPGAVTISGELDIDELERAFNVVIARHENLRTLFPSEGGQARQQILDRVDFRLDRVDLSGVADANEEAQRVCRAEANTPFDLANGPLLRGKVIKLSANEHVLLLNMHHIISDGWSIGVLVNELRLVLDAFRQGRQPQLPALPIQYADYAVWQRQWLEGGALEQQLAYWKTKLAGVPESLDLATDFPRPSVQSFAGARQSFTVDAQLTAALRQIAEQQGGTLYMALLAAFNVLLHRYTGQNDLCVGSPIANRQFHETEGLIGMFVNTLALRSRVEGETSFDAFLRQVKATCLEAYEHQDTPFEKIVDAVRPQRNMAVSPIFQVMLILQNVDMGTPDQRIRRYAIESGISKFDLTFELTETEAGLEASIEYSTALFKQSTVARMAEHFVNLCRAIAAAPKAKVRDFELLDAAESYRLVTEYNATGSAYPKDKTLPQLFTEQVALRGDRAAVICGGETMSFNELAERSGVLAAWLQSQGVGPETIVGLCTERSFEMMTGLLAIVRAGGAYLPLDPEYPDDRLAYMLEDSRTKVVLTQDSLRGRVAALAASDVEVIALDTTAIQPAGALRDVATPENLAYVIYTSGSTGRPKGVMIEHRSLVNYLTYSVEHYLSPNETECGSFIHFPLTFDASITSLFAPLVAGKAVEVSRQNAIETFKEGTFLARGYDFVKLTPAHLLLLRGNLENVPAESFTGRNVLVVGGEALTSDHVDFFNRTEADVEIVNEYGPTEATVGCTVSRFAVGKGRTVGNISIGTPIANTRIYILDAYGHVQPVGVPGELHIAGDCLARGYLNRPELTEERFVANPFVPGTRMYKTGDLARWLDDGDIEYLGRIDTQVKLRGFRIELGEIEARLNQHARIQDSAVVAQGRGADKHLVAFYTSPAGDAIPFDELRAHVQQALPEYMVPSAFVVLAAIPLNSNGKVDRNALARLDVTLASGREYVAPRSETELQLVTIWSEVLNLGAETIGVNDNFFELGGHSLLATQLVSRIRTRLAVDLPLKTLFERSSVAALADAIAGAQQSAVPAIRPIDRNEIERLPLSFAQERLWFIDQLEPGSAGYNVPGAVTIRGEVDVDQLERAFHAIIERHESLRTVFPSEGGTPRQQVLDSIEFRLERINAGSREEARRLCQADAVTPFDLANGPLLRGKVITISRDEHVLLLNMHHIISDGWSVGVLVRELGALLSGRELSPLPIQYADYAVWQRQWLEGGALEQQLGYWQKQLAGVPESLDLATDFARPAEQSFAGSTHAFAFDAQLTAALEQIAEQQGGTLYMALLAAFSVLLHRYTGHGDICVGSPIANRNFGETEGLIGMFVNTLALRSKVEGEQSFAALLRDVKATCLAAYEHQDAPFEKVVDAVRPQRNRAISPIFQVMLILQNTDLDALADIERFPLQTGISKFDLTFELTETESGLAGSIEYSTALYKPATIARMAEHFLNLCRAIAAAPNARVRDFDYLGQAEKHRLLVEYNDTAVAYPADKCIHDFFIAQVEQNGGRTAVTFDGRSLTYGELYDRASVVARYLQSQGVGPDTIVGLCMERSLELMVGIMATVLAGGAYMPLDPEYPNDRLTYMLEDSHAPVVLTQAKWRERIAALAGNDTKIVALDADALPQQTAELRRDVQPHNLCYVIYTSGSTGRPKGVLNEHRSLVNRLNWMQKSYPLTAADVVLQKTPYSFDVSVWEFFWPMMTGASIVFAAPGGHKDVAYLETLIDQAKVTTLHYVPSMLYTFLDNAAGTCGSVRQIFASGEALDKKAVDRYTTTFPNAILHNLYGPTEAAIDVTSFDCSSLDYGFVPIGKPIDNIQIHILDANDRLQPIGMPGELHIAGDGLARGYLNRPELTEEKFVANPFQAGARMYRTGDLARWLDDGNIQYLGRIDTQVKVRGFRIELGEIETRLAQHARVQDAALARGTGADRQLVAFYTSRDGAAVSYDELRAHLLETLPEYMVPAAFVVLDAIPLSSNGKVDRRALSGLDVTMTSTREYVAPRNDAETKLVEIWAAVLNVASETIGVHDNFFELGGHSLLATQLISKIRAEFGTDLPLKTIFERTSVAQLAEVVAVSETSIVPAIRPVDRSRFDRLPLSFAQERLWFINQLEPESAGYNVPAAVTIRGAVDVEAIERAFNTIIARHESLRTVFPTVEGRAHQRILDRVELTLERIEATREEAERLCRADAVTPFDLANGPLLRGKVITVGAEEHVLLVNMHHIISDGWSIGVLIRELHAILTGATLAPLPIQYADYAVWQRRRLEEGGVLEQQLAYWQQQLAGIPESLDLPTDFARPAVQSFAGATQPFAFDARLTAALKRIAEQHDATLYMVLMAAFNVLLHRYSGLDDICVGSPIANRQYGETEYLIGMFVNTLALRSRVDAEASFDAFLRDVKATCLEAYEHQDAPFEKVVDAVRPQRNMAISPIFQVMLILQNAAAATLGANIEPFSLETGIGKFDLTFELTETAEGLAGSIEYSTALYEPQTVARMAGHFVGLCEAIAAAPVAKIRDLAYLGEQETRQLASFNATAADYPRDKRILDFFLERVAAAPSATAIVAGDQRLTYRELYDRAHDVARYLQANGVGPDSIVGVCLERSVELMVAVYGTVLAGGAYMPLDPDYPDDRLTWMLEDSDCPVVLTQAKWAERIGALCGPSTAIVALDGGALPAGNAELRDDVQPHNLCYVIYTSGSTGRPKGVLNEHRALVNRLNWMQKAYNLTAADVVLQKTPYSFDVSVWELFWPMMTGSSLVFAAPGGHKDVSYLETLINDAGVTTLHFVPSMLYSFLDNAGGTCTSVKRVICSGEALDRKGVDRYQTRFPNAELHNLYGPTEAAIDVTAFDCAKATSFVSIGAPIDNIQIHILDAHGNVQPIGVPGELHIAGDALARGYLNRPELTEEKFVANPFVPGTRMYKTGDLARWTAGGDIQYLGRIDTQVKIRGFRIELGEIEARLNRHPSIEDGAVVPQGEGAAKHLVAFYTGAVVSNDELRAHLQQTLPEYMVPSIFVRLEAIPLSSNGKVDRRALSRTNVAVAAGNAYVAPRTGTETQLVAIWSEALSVAAETIGVNDNFFELGGHSLVAVPLMAKTIRAFGKELPLSALFTAPTVAAMAKLITGEEVSSFDILVPIRTGDATPYFAIPGAGGNVLTLRPLADALDRPLFGLQAVGLDGKAQPFTTVEETAQANVEAIKSQQPNGPYRLIGHSYGGVVAYEMARILLENGEDVSSLILLDSFAPSAVELGDEVTALVELVRQTNADLDLDVERLRNSTDDENARYIAGLAGDVNAEQLAAAMSVARANLDCYRNYAPARLPRAIEASLYRATQGRDLAALPADYGWSELLGEFRIHNVDASHHGVLSNVRV